MITMQGGEEAVVAGGVSGAGGSGAGLRARARMKLKVNIIQAEYSCRPAGSSCFKHYFFCE